MRTLYVLNIVGLILFFTVVESKRIKEQQLIKKAAFVGGKGKPEKTTAATEVKHRILIQQLLITAPVELPAQFIKIRFVNSK